MEELVDKGKFLFTNFVEQFCCHGSTLFVWGVGHDGCFGKGEREWLCWMSCVGRVVLLKNGRRAKIGDDSFSFSLFRFHGEEKKFLEIFSSGNENGEQIRFPFRNLAKKLAQHAKFSVTETEKKFVSVFVRGLQQPKSGKNRSPARD